MSSKTETQYQHLEPRPGSNYRPASWFRAMCRFSLARATGPAPVPSRMPIGSDPRSGRQSLGTGSSAPGSSWR